MLLLWSSGGILPTTLPCFALDTTTPTIQSCPDEAAVVAETAVPGAYQQACMMLTERHVTVGGTTHRLTVHQQTAAAGTTGLAVWNSSLLLSRLLQLLYYENHASLLCCDNCKTIVEVGCGPGLASMTAAVLLANKNHDKTCATTRTTTKILATDGNPAVVELCRSNLQANQQHWQSSSGDGGVVVDIEALPLPWGWMNAVDYAETADLIIGSDLTYQPANWPILVETVRTMLQPVGCFLYLTVGHAGFDVRAEMAAFLTLCLQQGLVQVVDDSSRLLSSSWSSMIPAQYATMEDWVLDTVVTAQERAVLESTGGVRIVVLQKKQLLLTKGSYGT